MNSLRHRRPRIWLLCICWALGVAHAPAAAEARVRVGAKNFTEGYLLGELLARTLEASGAESVERRFGLGNSGVVFRALVAGEFDVYPEYTGTIAEELLKQPGLTDWEELQNALAALGLVMTKPLGFENTYALAVREDFAEEHNLQFISDLRRVQDFIRPGFSHEFRERKDGLPGLLRHYGIRFSGEITGFEHSVAYTAIANNDLDLIDVYTTEARLRTANLRLLRDDQKFFPVYAAVILARSEFTQREPKLWQALKRLEGTIHEGQVRRWNEAVESEGKNWAEALAEERDTNFVEDRGAPLEKFTDRPLWLEVLPRLWEHVLLVLAVTASAVCFGIPLGILGARRAQLGRLITFASSVIQTIPSLALLCLLIPILGIGLKPALVALCLYGLLPVVVSTMTGILNVGGEFRELAQALGMNQWQRLWRVELPLAAPQIFMGLKTTTVMSIGTATIAALIGAGGLGALILAGLAVNDMQRVLLGAIPAAGLAMITHFSYASLARWLMPRGLKLK